MNWDDARIFLAVQRERSLRGAARSVGLDQATVGRRLAALEDALGTKLVLKTSAGYVLTTAGEVALDAAERIESAVIEMTRRAQGGDQRLAGEVRVTSTDSLGLAFLMSAFQRLHERHPDIRVVLHTSTQVLNLSKREADIAIRTVKPDNPDLLTRRITSWPVGLFASREYLRLRGEPSPGGAFAGHDLVVYQPHLQSRRKVTLVGEPITGGRVVAWMNSSLMVRSAIKFGLGLGEDATPLAEGDGLVRVWPDRTSANPFDIWLVTHQDLRHTARIQAAIDEILRAFDRPSGPV